VRIAFVAAPCALPRLLADFQRRDGDAVEKGSATEAEAEEAFLRMLRGKTALLSVKRYEE
jgi:hypothetical protein